VLDNHGLMLLLGIASVVAGVAIVLLHNVWNKGYGRWSYAVRLAPAAAPAS